MKDGKGGKQKEDILYYYSKKIDNYNKNDKIEDEDENDDENEDKNENDENERETENYFDENDHESDCYWRFHRSTILSNFSLNRKISNCMISPRFVF